MSTNENTTARDLPVSELKLGKRANTAALALGCNTIGDLASKTAVELLALRNFGRGSLDDIREKLLAHGLKLSGDE